MVQDILIVWCLIMANSCLNIFTSSHWYLTIEPWQAGIRTPVIVGAPQTIPYSIISMNTWATCLWTIFTVILWTKHGSDVPGNSEHGQLIGSCIVFYVCQYILLHMLFRSTISYINTIYMDHWLIMKRNLE